ncbi:hypothetical protein ACN20G_27680 (plasmid) [Streptomyces sp. BI20]|uniref:hypothetical protein n=1 Tax=Streptomyces sp. BI20 TaxID=3403460 RepID=UPI003C72CC6D
MAGAVLATSPAVALESSTPEARAWSHGTQQVVAVRDDSADGDEVYAEYFEGINAGKHELRNKKGAGHTVYSKKYTLAVHKLRACDEEDFHPDNCDIWRQD